MAFMFSIFVAMSTFDGQMPDILKNTPAPALPIVAALSLVYLTFSNRFALINYTGSAIWVYIGLAVFYPWLEALVSYLNTIMCNTEFYEQKSLYCKHKFAMLGQLLITFLYREVWLGSLSNFPSFTSSAHKYATFPISECRNGVTQLPPPPEVLMINVDIWDEPDDNIAWSRKVIVTETKETAVNAANTVKNIGNNATGSAIPEDVQDQTIRDPETELHQRISRPVFAILFITAVLTFSTSFLTVLKYLADKVHPLEKIIGGARAVYHVLNSLSTHINVEKVCWILTLFSYYMMPYLPTYELQPIGAEPIVPTVFVKEDNQTAVIGFSKDPIAKEAVVLPNVADISLVNLIPAFVDYSYQQDKAANLEPMTSNCQETPWNGSFLPLPVLKNTFSNSFSRECPALYAFINWSCPPMQINLIMWMEYLYSTFYCVDTDIRKTLYSTFYFVDIDMRIKQMCAIHIFNRYAFPLAVDKMKPTVDKVFQKNLP